MNSPSKSERGQTIVLLALSMVGLLGFTALAVDGGMTMNERRLAQSAADASSLAGAQAAGVAMGVAGISYDDISCTVVDGEWQPNLSVTTPSGATYHLGTAMTVAETTAVSRASSNTFAIDDDVTDKNGVEAQFKCEQTGWGLDKYMDVTTTITRGVPTAFVQLFIPGGLTNTVQSVVRVRPRTPIFYGKAVVGLKTTCDNSAGNKGGITFGGSNSTTITGGGVYSNACMVRNGTAPISAPGFGYVTGDPPSPNTSPPAVKSDEALPDFKLDPPDCSLVPPRSGPSQKIRGTKYEEDSDVYDPGQYSSLTSNGNWDTTRNHGTKIVLKPGLYCFSGDVSITGGAVEGIGVTLYFSSGNFKTGGGAYIRLEAPFDTSSVAIANHALPGVLIYMPESNVGSVNMTGNAGSTYVGLVYNPSGTCDVAGTTNGMHLFNSQVACGTVKITGDATINVNFNRYNAVLEDPLLEQNK